MVFQPRPGKPVSFRTLNARPVLLSQVMGVRKAQKVWNKRLVRHILTLIGGLELFYFAIDWE